MHNGKLGGVKFNYGKEARIGRRRILVQKFRGIMDTASGGVIQ